MDHEDAPVINRHIMIAGIVSVVVRVSRYPSLVQQEVSLALLLRSGDWRHYVTRIP